MRIESKRPRDRLEQLGRTFHLDKIAHGCVVEDDLHGPGPPRLAVFFVACDADKTQCFKHSLHLLQVLDQNFMLGSDLDGTIVGGGALEGQDAKVAILSKSEHATATGQFVIPGIEQQVDLAFAFGNQPRVENSDTRSNHRQVGDGDLELGLYSRVGHPARIQTPAAGTKPSRRP